jgi:hypothetical protein
MFFIEKCKDQNETSIPVDVHVLYISVRKMLRSSRQTWVSTSLSESTPYRPVPSFNGVTPAILAQVGLVGWIWSYNNDNSWCHGHHSKHTKTFENKHTLDALVAINITIKCQDFMIIYPGHFDCPSETVRWEPFNSIILYDLKNGEFSAMANKQKPK